MIADNIYNVFIYDKNITHLKNILKSKKIFNNGIAEIYCGEYNTY
jgi:hypothetical protein